MLVVDVARWLLLAIFLPVAAASLNFVVILFEMPFAWGNEGAEHSPPWQEHGGCSRRPFSGGTTGNALEPISWPLRGQVF